MANRVGAPVGSRAYGGYGVEVYGCAPLLSGNTFLQQSSAGVRFSGEQATSIVVGNTFRKGDRGVQIDDDSQPNLGDLGNAPTNDNGNNTFAGNSDYDIYNSTPNAIKAEGNTFASTSAETIDGRFIYDQLDSPSYGRVDYSPLKSGAPTAVVTRPGVMSVAAVPTSRGGAQIVVNLSAAGALQVEVLNLAGRPIRTWAAVEGKPGVNTLAWDGRSGSGTAVPAGAYLVAVTYRGEGGGQQRQVARVYVER